MDLPKFMPSTFKKEFNSWYNANQQSTYELCIYVQDKLNKDNIWMENLYNTVKGDSDNYGNYAGLNNWSHTFTDIQLNNFINRCSQVKLNKYILYIMVKKIRNPETGRMVNVNGKIGQRVLSQYGGGKPLSSRSRDRENQQRAARELKQKKAQKGTEDSSQE